jgi:cytochrome P450
MNPATTSGHFVPIGERFNPLSGEQLENPYVFYEEARRKEPVFFSPAFGMWVVTRYDDAATVVGNPALFSSKESIKTLIEICPQGLAVLATGVPMTATVVNSDPPEHGRWRNVMNKAFSASRMRRLEQQIREITNPGSMR